MADRGAGQQQRAYFPRKPSFERQEARRAAEQDAARAVVVDRWSSEAQRSFGLQQPQEPVVPEVPVGKEPVGSVVFYDANDLPGGDAVPYENLRPPFANYAARSKNAFVTGQLRPVPSRTPLLARPIQRPMSAAYGSPARVSASIQRAAMDPGYAGPLIVAQPESGRSAAAAFRQTSVPKRFARQPSATARSASAAGGTTRAGLTADEVARRHREIGRLRRSRSSEHAAQTEAPGGVDVLEGDDARAIYSTHYGVCRGCGRVHRNVSPHSTARCAGCGASLIRLYAPEVITPALEFKQLRQGSAQVPAARPAPIRSASADAAGAGRERVIPLCDFANGLGSAVEPLGSARSRRAGGGDASAVRSCLQWYN
jgi:hypothetical protein